MGAALHAGYVVRYLPNFLKPTVHSRDGVDAGLNCIRKRVLIANDEPLVRYSQVSGPAGISLAPNDQ